MVHPHQNLLPYNVSRIVVINVDTRPLLSPLLTAYKSPIKVFSRNEVSGNVILYTTPFLGLTRLPLSLDKSSLHFRFAILSVLKILLLIELVLIII